MRKIIGIDIAKINRFKNKDRLFIERILSKKECEVFDSFNSKKRQIEYLASRFSVKEAYKKAYQVFEHSLNFNEISVLNTESGAPFIESPYRKEDSILVSISHEKKYVITVVFGETTH
jgi:holo-[acyl-carrier protein] synthase